MPAFAYTQTSGSSIPETVFRGQVDQAGDPIYEDVDKSILAVPPTGQYHLRLTGFAKPYTEAIPERYLKENGPTTTEKTSVELEIAEGRGAGKRFFWNFVTFSLGGGDNPSHLRRVYIAGVMNGAKPAPGAELFYDDLIGCEFVAYVQASEKRDEKGRPTYATVTAKTIAPVPTSVEDDPFADDEAA